MINSMNLNSSYIYDNYKISFLTMKLVKMRLCNKINDDFLDDNSVVNIEKEIVMDFITDMIVDEFYSIKDHRG
jgi:hypothetical protein